MADVTAGDTRCAGLQLAGVFVARFLFGVEKYVNSQTVGLLLSREVRPTPGPVRR